MTTAWTITVFCVFAIILLEIIKQLSKISEWNKKLDALPGPPKSRWPLLGHLYLFAGLEEHDIFGLMDKLSNEFRHVGCYLMSLTAFGPSELYLITAENVSKLLQNTDHLAKGDGYEMIAEYIGDGLVTSKPEKWRHHRELINPSFTFKMFDNFIRIFNEQSSIMVELLREKFNHIEREDEGFMDLSSFISRCSLDIILEAAFGTKVEAQINEFSEIHHAVESAVHGIGKRMNKPWYRSMWIYWNLPEGRKSAKHIKYWHEFIEKIVHQRMKERLEGTVDYSDGPKSFLDILLDSADKDKSLTIQDIIDETITIGGAGHDTAATAINLVFFMLAVHPHHQRKVQEELDTVFSKSSQNGFISSGDLSQMKYLERCIKETLRLYPAVSGFIRKLQSDLLLENGIVAPKGLNVTVPLSALHKDPKTFPNPERFDPDRFLPENCVGRHQCAYIPFSAGPRNCIGQKFGLMEAKMQVASVLRDFNVHTKDTVKDLKLIPSITLILANPIHMKLIPRVTT